MTDARARGDVCSQVQHKKRTELEFDYSRHYKRTPAPKALLHSSFFSSPVSSCCFPVSDFPNFLAVAIPDVGSDAIEKSSVISIELDHHEINSRTELLPGGKLDSDTDWPAGSATVRRPRMKAG